MIVNSSAATHLYGQNAYKVAELYTFTGAAGSLAITTWPTTLLSAYPAVIKRGQFKMTLGGEVATCDITIAEGSLAFGGQPLCRAAIAGLLNDVVVTVERILDVGGSNIRVPRFVGLVQQVEPMTGTLRIVAKSRMSLLDAPIPARTVQPNCPYRFKDAACAYAGSTTVCDKTQTACKAMSGGSNFIHFGGFPKTPAPWTLNQSPWSKRDGTAPIQSNWQISGFGFLAGYRRIAKPDASAYARPVPVVYGRCWVDGLLISAASTTLSGFTSLFENNAWNGNTAGKGRVLAFGLAEGPATLLEVTRDGVAIPKGSGQSPSWDYLGFDTTNRPLTQFPLFYDGSQTAFTGQDTAHDEPPYNHTAILAGMFGIISGEIPSLKFFVEGFLSDSNGACDPAAVLADLWSNTRYGLGLDPSLLDTAHGADGTTGTSYDAWIAARDWKVAAALDSQRSAAEHFQSLLFETYSRLYMAPDGKVRVIPLDPAVTMTPQALNQNDFVMGGHDDSPVKVERVPTGDVYNVFPVAIHQEGSTLGQSVEVPYEYTAFADLSNSTPRRASTYSATWITDKTHAVELSHLLAQHSIKVRNTYRFTLSSRWILLTPGDLVSLTEPVMGISGKVAIIISTEQNENGDILVTAAEWDGLSNPPAVSPSPPDGLGGNPTDPRPDPPPATTPDLSAIEARLAALSSDNRITNGEKGYLISLMSTLFGEHSALMTQASLYSPAIDASSYDADITALLTYARAAVPADTSEAAGGDGLGLPATGSPATFPPTQANYTAWYGVPTGIVDGKINVNGETLRTVFADAYVASVVLKMTFADRSRGDIASLEGMIGEIARDGLLTGPEKRYAWQEYKNLIDEYAYLYGASAAAACSSYAAYGTAITNLKNYMKAPQPAEGVTPVDGTAQTNPTHGLNMGKAADGSGTLTDTPSTAQVAAWMGYSTAIHPDTFRKKYGDALAAVALIHKEMSQSSWDRLTAYSSDGVITQGEKAWVFREYARLMRERAQIDLAADNGYIASAVQSDQDIYDRALWNLQKYMLSLGCPPDAVVSSGNGTTTPGPPWATNVPIDANLTTWETPNGTTVDVHGDTVIVPATFMAKWNDAYTYQATLLRRISEETSNQAGAAYGTTLTLSSNYSLRDMSNITGTAISAAIARNNDLLTAAALSSTIIGDGTAEASGIRANAIGARAIASDSILARHLLVSDFGGAALNKNPDCSDITAWGSLDGAHKWLATPVAVAVQPAVTGGKVGVTSLRSTAGLAGVAVSKPVPVDAAKRYRVKCWARASAAATAGFWLAVVYFDEAGVAIAAPDGWGTGDFYHTPGGNQTVDAAAWLSTTGWVGGIGFTRSITEGGSIPSAARTMSVAVRLNTTPIGGRYHEVQDVRIEEQISADLMVDGTITGVKIKGGEITAGHLAIAPFVWLTTNAAGQGADILTDATMGLPLDVTRAAVDATKLNAGEPRVLMAMGKTVSLLNPMVFEGRFARSAEARGFLINLASWAGSGQTIIGIMHVGTAIQISVKSSLAGAWGTIVQKASGVQAPTIDEVMTVHWYNAPALQPDGVTRYRCRVFLDGVLAGSFTTADLTAIGANIDVVGNYAGVLLGAAGTPSPTLRVDNLLLGQANVVIGDGAIRAEHIQAGTIDVTRLNFAPVTGANVVASINATAEGIRILGSRITIDGSVSFGSNYDPSTKDTPASAQAKADAARDAAINAAAIDATNKAGSVQQLITDIASDAKIAPAEKSTVGLDLRAIYLEATNLIAEAAIFGAPVTGDAAYTNFIAAWTGASGLDPFARQAASTTVSGGLGLASNWISSDANNISAINAFVVDGLTYLVDGPTLRARFAAYYKNASALINKMTDVSRSMAQTALDTVGVAASDNSIILGEKPPLADILRQCYGQQVAVVAQASAFTLTLDPIYTAFVAAWSGASGLNTYVTAVTGNPGGFGLGATWGTDPAVVTAWVTNATAIAVDGITMRARFSAFYAALANLQTRLVDAAKSQATSDAATFTTQQIGTVNSKLADISSDDKITPGEKQEIALDLRDCYAGYQSASAQAVTFGLSGDPTYSALMSAWSGGNAGLNDYALAAPPAGLGLVAPAWVSGVAYVVGDVRVRSAVIYRCILAHTSSGGNGPPNATYWVVTTETWATNDNILNSWIVADDGGAPPTRTTLTVVGATMRTRLGLFYLALENLNQRIAQQALTNANSNTTTLLVPINSRLDAIASDGQIQQGEKPPVAIDLKAAYSAQAAAMAQAQSFSLHLPTPIAEYSALFDATTGKWAGTSGLNAYAIQARSLVIGTPGGLGIGATWGTDASGAGGSSAPLNSFVADAAVLAVDGTVFRLRFSDFYTALENLLQKIANAARTLGASDAKTYTDLSTGPSGTVTLRLAAIASDNVVTPDERPELALDLRAAFAAQAAAAAQAQAYALTGNALYKAVFDPGAAWTVLAAYATTAAPNGLGLGATWGTDISVLNAWAAGAADIAITGTVMRQRFADFYAALEPLNTLLIDTARVRAQSYFDTIYAKFTDDGLITRGEKAGIADTLRQVYVEQADLASKATTLGLASDGLYKALFDPGGAWTVLNAYIMQAASYPIDETGTGATGGLGVAADWGTNLDARLTSFVSEAKTLVVNPATLRTTFGNYYDAVAKLWARLASVYGHATDQTKIDGAKIYTGTVQAQALNVLPGGGNILQDSSFDAVSGPLPFYLYTYGAEGATLTGSGRLIGGIARIGRQSFGSCIRVAWPGANTQNKGFYFYNGLRGLAVWGPGQTYVISFWARISAGADGQGCSLYWNTQPAAMVALLNPALSASWQRYAFRVTWGASVEANGRFYASVIYAGNQSYAWAEFDDVQVEEGDLLTSYAPMTDEMLPGTVQAALMTSDVVQTADYYATGVGAAEVAKRGVKLRSTAGDSDTVPPLLIGPGGAKVGSYLMDEVQVSALKGLGRNPLVQSYNALLAYAIGQWITYGGRSYMAKQAVVAGATPPTGAAPASDANWAESLTASPAVWYRGNDSPADRAADWHTKGAPLLCDPPWQQNTAYQIGDRVLASFIGGVYPTTRGQGEAGVAGGNGAGQRIYLCIQAGVSAASGAGPTATSGTQSDGTVLWAFYAAAASGERLTIAARNFARWWSPQGVMLSYVATIQPRSPSDNLDGLRYLRLRFFSNATPPVDLASLALFQDVFIPVPDRLYFNPLNDSDPGNAARVSFDVLCDGSGYISPNAYFTGYMRASLYNVNGPSAERDFFFVGTAGNPGSTVGVWPAIGVASGGGGGGGGGGCVSPDTLVLVSADGKSKPASALRVGDHVWTTAADDPGRGWGLHRIDGWEIDRNLRMSFAMRDGRRFICSINHLMRVGGIWRRADSIGAGTHLDGHPGGIVDSAVYVGEGPVIKMSIPTARSYVAADGSWHHNGTSKP